MFPAWEFPGCHETIAQSCGRAVAAMGRPGPGVRRRRASFAGEHCPLRAGHDGVRGVGGAVPQGGAAGVRGAARSEEHTSELQSRLQLVCRLLLELKIKEDHGLPYTKVEDWGEDE